MLSYVMKYCNSVCLIEHIEQLKLFDNDSIIFFSLRILNILEFTIFF